MSSPIASTSYLPPPQAVLLSSSPASLPTSLSTAATILQHSGLVAFPTETVYGLGASALSEEAVRSIFAAKGRPRDNPLIVHVASREMLEGMLPGSGRAIPRLYEPLMRRFWPGPLTLVFPLTAGEGVAPPAKAVAPSVLAGHASLAVRWPQHPLSLALIAAADLPLAAPSANLSSRPSPTTAAHVAADLGVGRGVGAIFDGGACEVGLESTVVDWVPPEEGEEGEGVVRVLRAGGVGPEELEECLREAGYEGGVGVWGRDFRSDELAEKPTTPGMKYKHYAPTNARVVLVQPTRTVSGDEADNAPELSALIASLVATSATATATTPSPIKVGLMLSTDTLARLSPSYTPPPALPFTSSPFTLPPPSPSASDCTAPAHSPAPEPELLSFPLGRLAHPAEAAARLFAGLRHFDALPGVEWVLVEAVEEAGVGIAVMERARKSAGGVARGEVSEFRIGV